MKPQDKDLIAQAFAGGFFPGMENAYGQEVNPAEAPPPTEMPVTTPDQAYDQAPQENAPAQGMFSAPPSPQPGSRSGSYGASERAFDPNKFAQIRKTEGQLAADNYKVKAEAAAHAATLDAKFATANQHQIDAAAKFAEDTHKKLMEEGAQAQLQKNMEGAWADEEAKFNVQASSDAAKARNDYMVALSDFRASGVNPSQLWQGMSGGQQFGTLVSVFAHDFLGARGIHTSAMDTLNTAISRNIDAQVQGIKIKGEVAQGFKDLWYMQRSQSNSDMEARTRVRGFMLEAAKQQTIAALAPFQAGLASDQGKAAVAMLEGEMAKNYLEVDKHVTKNAQDEMALNNSRYNAQLQAAMTQRSINESARQFDATHPVGSPINQKDVIVDEFGNPVSRFREGTPDPIKIKFLEKQDATNTLVKDSQEYLSMLRNYDAIKASPGLLKRFRNEHDAEMVALQARIRMNEQRRVTGLAANPGEVENIKNQIPIKDYWQNYEVNKIVAQFAERGRSELDQGAKDYTIPLTEVEKAGIPKGSINLLSPSTGKDLQDEISGKNKIKSSEQVAAAEFTGLIHGDESSNLYEGNAADIKAGHKRMVKELPALAASSYTSETLGGTWDDARIVQAEVGLTRLAEMAKAGNKESLDQLRLEAKAYREGHPGSESDWRGAMAAFLLSDVLNKKDINGFNPSAPSDEAINKLGGGKADAFLNPGSVK